MLEGISLLGDTLWSVPVPILGGRERVNQSPGSFQAAYDVARYTADLGRFSKAIELFGEASSMGGLDARPYARRGELFLLLRRLDRALSDLRTAGRLNAGEPIVDQQVTASGEMVDRNFAFTIPSLLGMAYTVRGDSGRAADYFTESALRAGSLRDALQTTLWFRASNPTGEFPSTLPSRFRSAATTMLRNSTRGAGAAGCPVITGTMIDGELACYVHGARLLAALRPHPPAVSLVVPGAPGGGGRDVAPAIRKRSGAGELEVVQVSPPETVLPCVAY